MFSWSFVFSWPVFSCPVFSCPVVRRALLLVAFALVTISVAIAASGGFATSLLGVRLSAHSPRPTAAGATLAFAVWFLAAWRSHVKNYTFNSLASYNLYGVTVEGKK